MLRRRPTAPETVRTLQRKVRRNLAELNDLGPAVLLDAPADQYVSELQPLARDLDMVDPTRAPAPELLQRWARVQDFRLRPRR